MKLSDAIELGSTMIGEDTSTYFVAGSCKGCALGAAWVAVGMGNRLLDNWKDINSLFPIGSALIGKVERRPDELGDHLTVRCVVRRGVTVSTCHAKFPSGLPCQNAREPVEHRRNVLCCSRR